MHESCPRHRARRTRWFGHGRTRALLAAGMLLGVGAVGTSAYWTSSKQVPGASITAGEIHLDLGSSAPRTKPETYAWGSMGADVNPGESRARILRVSNNSRGALRFSYSLSATATNNALGNALKVTVIRGGTSNGTTCTAAPGSSTPISNAGFPIAATSVGTITSTAATPYDDVCIQVSRPTGTSAAGGLTASLSFVFTATQVVS